MDEVIKNERHLLKETFRSSFYLVLQGQINCSLGNNLLTNWQAN